MNAIALALVLSAAPPANSDPHDVYLEAYAIREEDPDRARASFTWVVEHTTPDDSEHEKAARWLKDLRNKHTKKKRR